MERLPDPRPAPVCRGDQIRAVWEAHAAKARRYVPGGVLNSDDLAGLVRRVANQLGVDPVEVREAVYG